jgi:ssDNA-binding Zn-finger/Zn-ribbon topoisomerase 1
MTYDREALAWAAGFFDGEGCASFSNVRRFHLNFNVRQATDDAAVVPEVLIRFRDAVGLGRIHGPERRPRRERPQYVWQAGSFEDCQAVLALLWPWLGTIKRAQAARALKAVPRFVNRYGDGYCRNGHFLKDGRSRNGTCPECHRESYRRLQAKRKADKSLPWWQRTHCPQGHDLDAVGRDARGDCKECSRIRQRRRTARRQVQRARAACPTCAAALSGALVRPCPVHDRPRAREGRWCR